MIVPTTNPINNSESVSASGSLVVALAGVVDNSPGPFNGGLGGADGLISPYGGGGLSGILPFRST